MSKSASKSFEVKTYQIALPVVIGLGVVLFMFWREFFPKTKINDFEEHSEITYYVGDTLFVVNDAALYSTDTLLAVNAKRLLRYAPAGTPLLVNKEPVFKVIAQQNKKLQCVVEQQIAISGGEYFSLPKKRLYATNLIDVVSKIKISWHTIFFVFLAFALMFGRDAGYVARLHVLSEGRLSWMQCLRVIILWEFTSAVTPSAIGGTSIATLYINKEGISVGKSSAIVLTTSLLDEIYFVVMFPLLLLFISHADLFGVSSAVGNKLLAVALGGYAIKFAWVLLLIYGLFFNPQGLRNLIIKVFSLPLLRRWKQGAIKAGDDVAISAVELRKKSFGFWFKSFGTTFLSWTSRYWVVNALFVAFFAVNDHLLIFARQLVMWIMMLISPTPGGSGFAEYVFKEFLGDFIPNAGLIVVLALLWRFISYYLYLLLGVIVVPTWVRNKFGKKPQTIDNS
ncbi:hypothetical protein FACS189467_7450 [Bacteroidia bacterium]|nr:hypothetical protein FACS189467_7450 [Bacteroidia bacterium]